MITEEELAIVANGIFMMNKELEMTRKALCEMHADTRDEAIKQWNTRCQIK